MSNVDKEIKYLLCFDHSENCEKSLLHYHPSYRFNVYYVFPGKKCSYTNCSSPAFYEAIGIRVPEYMPKNTKASHAPEKEIFYGAKELLENGAAIDRTNSVLEIKNLARMALTHL